MKKQRNGLVAIILIAAIVIVGVLSYRVNQDIPANKAPGARSASTADNMKKSGSKVLVVYFSAQHHTRRVAERVAKNLNADTFVIEPQNPYSENDLNWNDTNSRIDREYDRRLSRNIKLKTTTVPNWDDYDTVLIGYPIWWSIAAWPTDSFVKAQDFTGKTVIPFCTSFSSGIGDSAKNLQNEAKGGTWQQGHRFDENTSLSAVDRWTDSLGL